MPELRASWRASGKIVDDIYIPKYYDDEIERDYASLAGTHDVVTIGELIKRGVISTTTGHEIGKAAYGTGDIPFVRTSDIANWEIKTAPKQGVSAEQELYAKRQAVQVGDILFVRDGTYLIGRNCFITNVDRDLIYQSHVVKIHSKDDAQLRPEILFLALNSPLVQREIRSKQFTADIIDTIGQRINEVRIPIPKDAEHAAHLADDCATALSTRSAGKALIKQMPTLVEEALRVGDAAKLHAFVSLPTDERAAKLTQRTVTSEFGEFTHQWIASSDIVSSIFMPKYYDHSIAEELTRLEEHCELRSIASLIDAGAVTVASGVEPGKAVYGTGEIPFLRTSDFTNWEVAGDPKQGVSESVYAAYAAKAALADKDVLLVRDGTYLVGSSCIVTDRDAKRCSVVACSGSGPSTIRSLHIFCLPCSTPSSSSASCDPSSSHATSSTHWANGTAKWYCQFHDPKHFAMSWRTPSELQCATESRPGTAFATCRSKCFLASPHYRPLKLTARPDPELGPFGDCAKRLPGCPRVGHDRLVERQASPPQLVLFDDPEAHALTNDLPPGKPIPLDGWQGS